MQQRDLEAREPILAITGPQLSRAATIAFKVKNGLVGAGRIAHYGKSGIEFGAAVAPIFPHRTKREFNELDARRISGATRPHQQDLEDPEVLEARRVSGAVIRKVFNGIAGGGGHQYSASTGTSTTTKPTTRPVSTRGCPLGDPRA
ncbi:hypothetical protein M413DRAFT_442433 [Hebeloma cylindrosporum]|uniref:Uncharacterized protein n=1 Tax=Hebeloma cylindrosporum TaxID=76867 RepID=A0A0C2YTU3_HEBCY|nr:hypothetical protein M413DRAFT_442433 [Hebeloma cylindrosporum h7]